MTLLQRTPLFFLLQLKVSKLQRDKAKSSHVLFLLWKAQSCRRSYGVTNAIPTVPASVRKLNEMQPVEHGIGDRLLRGKSVQVLFILEAFWLPRMLMTDTLPNPGHATGGGRREETLLRLSL